MNGEIYDQFYFVIVLMLNRCICLLLFRKLSHPTLLDEKSKRSKFIIDAEKKKMFSYF